MGFFNEDDSFEEIFNEVFKRQQGISNRQNQVIKGEQEERIIDFVETSDKIFLVFELLGYRKQDVLVAVKGKKIIIDASKKQGENIQSYLSQKLGQGRHIEKTIPDFVKTKKFDFTLKNGVLEVVFKK